MGRRAREGGRFHVLYLTVTMGPSPEELSVTPAKGPDRERAAVSSGEPGSVCPNEAERAGRLDAGEQPPPVLLG